MRGLQIQYVFYIYVQLLHQHRVFFFFWLEDLSLFLLRESWGGGATEVLSLYFGSLSDPPCSEVFIPNSVVIFCFLPHKPVISTHGHFVTSSLEFFFIKKLHLFFFVFFTISFFFYIYKSVLCPIKDKSLWPLTDTSAEIH